ncbi:methyl-accepting chemotaxis protein [Pseudomonadota bacterium]
MSIYNLFEQRKSTYLEREASLKSQVELAISIIDHYAQQQAVLGLKNAQQQAIAMINAVRYDNNNYFWIIDPDLNIVTHPLKPQLQGTNASQLTDGGGKYHWREMAAISRQSGEGYLDYSWRAPNGDIGPKLSFVKLSPAWNWIVGTGIHVKDIEEAFQRAAINVGFIAAVAMIILLSAGYAISHDISKPIEGLVDKFQAIAEGDLSVNCHLDRHDEIGKLARRMDISISSIREVITAANVSASKSAEMAGSIASASEESAHSIQSQHIQLEQLATAMNEMTATVVDVARNAEQTSLTTEAVSQKASASSDKIAATTQNIQQVAQEISHADKLVDQLKQGVLQIGEVTDVIKGISEQTNLLALNAAIEAARAGDQGRGFAVVADEVRNLAQRTQISTEEIQSTINALTHGALEAADAMRSSHQSSQRSVDTAKDSQNELQSMVDELYQSNDRVAQIAAAAEQQGTVSEDINRNVSSIDLSANEVNAAAQHLANHSQTLAVTAEELQRQLQQFKV